MGDTLQMNDPGAQKRRSTRIVQAVPISVTGVDALGQPFKERTTTVMVNCHGCKYQSKHYVPKNSVVTLEIPRPEANSGMRMVSGRVIWVQRPRAVRELFQIGLEFDIAGNVWGIAFPPEDWFPVPGEEAAARPAPPQPTPMVVPPAKEPEPVAEAAAPIATPPPAVKAPEPPAAPVASAVPPSPAATTETSKIHVVPEPLPSPETQLAVARQMAKAVADVKENLDKSVRKEAQAAVNDEMAIVRQQLDAELHEAVEKAIKVSMERVTESSARKVITQAAERTAAIVEEARRANEVTAGQLDAKIRDAVQQAVTNAAESAAQQAAAQAATQNLKQTVEDTVTRVLIEREAVTPSLQILSSPEAAQQHIDQWKKNLEEVAQGVRQRTIEQARAESDAAKARLSQEFESAVAGASQQLNEAVAQAKADSDAAKARWNQEFEGAVTGASQQLHEAVAQARADGDAARLAWNQEFQSAVTGASQKLNETLASNTQNAVEQARQHIDEMMSARSAEMERRVDELIAQRAARLEPVLQAAAQKMIEHFAAEMTERLAPGMSGARQALSDLASASQQAAQLESKISEQTRRASEESARIESRVSEQVRRAGQEVAQIEASTREQIRQASERIVAESLDRARDVATKLPGEFEESCKTVLSKMEEDLEQKTAEVQHSTYESLLKAADWYQKKAQTTMQGALEKAVEQSTSALRDRAGEISSLVASELDHYRRTYVDHSQAQMEEAAKEIIDRERARFKEVTEEEGTGFTNRVEQLAGDSLRRFEQASQEALEKTRSDMEYDREGSLAEFREKVDAGMRLGVEQARAQLQSQLAALMEDWEAKQAAQQAEWVEQAKRSSNESIEEYKARLENASNSWLLASATTLGQNSQAVMDVLAKSAEKRLRDTFAQVFSGMGDTLKERLTGISGRFAQDDDEETPGNK